VEADSLEKHKARVWKLSHKPSMRSWRLERGTEMLQMTEQEALGTSVDRHSDGDE
jgi:hypothetical protein